jgi:DNA repair protein RadD
MQLRAYQQLEIIDPLMAYLCEHDGDPLVAAPTGVGKSLAINGFVKQSLEADPSLRFLIVTHTKEVIAQNAQSMLDFWRAAPIGCYSAGLSQFDTRKPIIYAGIQSVYKRAEEFGIVDGLICDEAHTISPRESTMWQTFIRDLRRINPNIRVIGFTATPFRQGTGTLVEGGIFTKIVVDLTTTERINQFVAEGYLCPLISKKPAMEIDITNVKMKGGEFDEHELAAVTDRDDLNRAVVAECIRQGADRKHWLVFATGTTHAAHLLERFRAAGITCETIDGTMPEAERTRLIGDKAKGIQGAFQKGQFRALINIGVLTTGFDFPAIDMIVLVRATQSTGLYVQILGRGTRPAPEKSNCKVLDFGSNITRLGPFNAPILPRPRKKGDASVGEAPVKACPECGTYVHTRTTECEHCGFVFPPPSHLDQTASQAKVMVDSAVAPVTAIMDVLSTHYSEQLSKQPGWGSLVKVSYGDLVNTLHEFFFPEAPLEWKRKEFNKFWITAGGQVPVPSTAEQFIERARKELKAPKKVYYEANTKYKNVTKKEY